MNYSINYLFRFATANLGSLTAATAAASAMAEAMGRAGSAVAALGVVGAAGGAALGGMFVAAIREAAKFEDKMAEVRKVVPDMTKETMWAMGKEVQRLAIWSGEAKENIADIFAGGARQGIHDTAALAKFAETVTKVKVAWDGVSASMAGESLATISSKFFGKEDPLVAQEKMVGVADAINYLGQNTAAVKPKELLNWFVRGGNQFAGIGFTGEEAAAYGAAAMTAGSPSGAMEGTLSRSTIQRLRNAPFQKKNVGALKALGYNPTQFAKALNTKGPETMLDLITRLEKVPADKRGLILKNLLGDQKATSQLENIVRQSNEFKRALATTSDKWATRLLNDKPFMDWLRKTRPIQAKMLEENKRALHWGSVDAEFKTRLDTLVQQMKRVGEAWDYVLVQMGKGALPTLTPWVSSLADALERLANNKGMLEAFGSALTALGTGAALVGIGLLTTRLLGLGKNIGFVVRALGGLAVFGAAGIAIAILVTGLASVYWIYDNWERVKQLLADPINVDIHFPDMPDWLKWVWKNSFKDSKDIIGDAWNTQGKDPYRYSEGDFNRAQKYSTVPNFGPRMTVPNFYPLGAPPERTWGQWLSGTDPTWGATPFGSATSAMPGAMNQRIDVNATTTFQPATLAIQYNGPLGGPDSVSLQANPARGQSTAEGGGGSGRPWAQ